MKVVVVCDVYGEKNNGTTIAAVNLINYLKEVGEDVTVLCADKKQIGKEGYAVVPNLNLGKLANHILDKNSVTLARPKRSIIDNAIKDADIVHIMMPFALGRKTLKIARELNIPITAGFHCQAENVSSHFGVMDNELVNKLIYKNFYRHFYNQVDSIHYPTEFIHQLFEKEVHHKTDAYVISNGVNDNYKKIDITKRQPPLDKYFNILTIGRLCKEKSQKLLIEAVSLSKHKNEIQIVLAGKGPDKDKILKHAKKYKVRKPVIKFFTRKDLNIAINSCDLYVHPAEIEIEAISCLEAITCGLVPVISNSKRSATNKFALSEKNLFQYDSPQDLADKIDYWIEHPEEKEKCSEQYLGYTKQFDQRKCMEQMHDMLKTCIKLHQLKNNEIHKK